MSEIDKALEAMIIEEAVENILFLRASKFDAPPYTESVFYAAHVIIHRDEAPHTMHDEWCEVSKISVQIENNAVVINSDRYGSWNGNPIWLDIHTTTDFVTPIRKLAEKLRQADIRWLKHQANTG
jgi:hypothetical protein